MKTLLSINNYYYRRGGAETVFFEHNQLFEAQGWQVVPFAMKHPGNLPSAWSDYFVDEIEFESKYSLLQKLVRVPKVIYSMEARRKLDRLLQRVSPDICHAHNIYHHISPSILGLLRQRGVPVVMTLHDLKIACPAYRMLNSTGICERCKGGAYYHVLRHRCVKDSLALSGVAFLESTLHRLLGTYVRHVTRFVVPSRFYISKFVEWGFPQELFVHVPNFIDIRAFEPAADSGESFVFAGRLSPEKGVSTLVKAAALAKVSLQVAGTGPEAESLQRLAVETGADVEFLGHLDSAHLKRVIAKARAVVVPSEWYENAPLAVLEANAMGKPVIGSDIAGIPELIRRGETGELFTAGNVTALAECLQRMAGKPPAELLEMGVAARRWIEQEFSSSRYMERMQGLYAQIDSPATGIR